MASEPQCVLFLLSSALPFSLSVRLLCLVIAPQALLRARLICPRVSSFLSDERSIHLSLGDGTQAPLIPPTVPRGWHPALRSVLPETAQLTLCSEESQALPKRSRDKQQSLRFCVCFFFNCLLPCILRKWVVVQRCGVMSTLSSEDI